MPPIQHFLYMAPVAVIPPSSGGEYYSADIGFDNGLVIGATTNGGTHYRSTETIMFSAYPGAVRFEMEMEIASISYGDSFMFGLFRTSSDRLRYNANGGIIQRNGSTITFQLKECHYTYA